MPARIAGLALAAALMATPALAAPICWNARAEAVRCEAPGALPVGAELTPEQEALRLSRAKPASARALAGLAMVLAGVFALIGLMPNFERFDR